MNGTAPAVFPGAVEICGVGACRGGWLAVHALPGRTLPTARVFPRFGFLLDAIGEDAQIVVGMPIGLPERIEGPGRAAEKAVRPLLGMRQSSVFSMPARRAVVAAAPPYASELARREAHQRCCAVARQTSHPPRGVSIQGFSMFARILELDAILRARPALLARVVEGHPEVAFMALNGGTAMATPKRVRNVVDAAGIEERRALLLRHAIPRDFLHAPPPPGAALVDSVDGAALLLVAARRAVGTARPYPDPPAQDAHGLPIAIWA
ncbi:MAG: DUF429 domain-containing protein [Aurantimonas endophytica]|uniref:Putative RNase H-like nuclease n=1 Tax=Aurantimonas endophytica TaxID=1522175 RepID=A0A7W6MRJ9_9HYPH|nr:DUF429 domain-containing protein [Aurantimonas endophytica]MBB4005059.1 putative RNase H-like nuclease [Aurantimonas endophytica]MCO6406275.1 DUF429 domain-containing protein [Aurantimonas endophytica]